MNLILRITPRQLAFVLDLIDLSKLSDELIWGTIAGILIAILVILPLRRLLRSLIPSVVKKIASWSHLKVVRDEVAARETKEEREYLKWRKDHLQPLPGKSDEPISIPATKKDQQ